MSKNMSKQTNRREFIKGAAAAGIGFWAVGRGAWAEEAAGVSPAASTSPSEKLNIAMVGTSNRAGANLEEVKGQNIVALCDVDENYLGNAGAQFPRAKRYVDFREMLEQKDIDAVLVATADHTHVPASHMALTLGRHVYCEKPLAHNVWEARLVAEAAAKHKRVTQMGTQIHAEPNYRRVVELIRAGVIGPVKEVHVFIDKMWSPANDPPREVKPVPAGLNYDLWLGPAPEQPYRTNMLPANWRKWWDFGSGTLGDMGCHYMDLPFWALSLRHPTKISTEGPPPDKEGTPPWLVVHYEYPARKGADGADLGPVKMSWYDGGKRPAAYDSWELPSQGPAQGPRQEWRNGVMFVGEKGNLIADYSRHKLLPEKEFAGYTPPASIKKIRNSIGHHNEWIKACKKNDPTLALCNFDYSGALTESVLLGAVAYRVGKPLDWDAKALKATNAPEADQYVRRQYRKGWELA